MTTLLLDTHIALWWLADDPRLGHRLREAVEQSEAAHLSAASTWEVAIKTALGKLDLDLPEGRTFAQTCSDQGFTLTAITHEDAGGVGALPPARADPFDRLIAATAKRRGWTVVTGDPAFEAFGVELLMP